MLVLGVQRGHDANAALMADGYLAVVCEAERVLGVKHADGLAAAALAAERALREVGASAREVDAIVICDSYRDRIEKIWPGLSAEMHRGQLVGLGTVGHLAQCGGELGVVGLRHETPVYGVCHHLAHAFAAYFMSGFDAAASLVVDGYGVCAGTAAYVVEGNNVELIPGYTDRFLLGWRYQLFGEFIADINKDRTKVYDLAGKVMGLQAYGNPSDSEYFKEWFRRDYEDYLLCWTASANRFFADRFANGGFMRDSTNAQDRTYLDALASMQVAFTELICEAAADLVQLTKQRKLVVSGGCALNVVSNTELARRFGDSLYIAPNSGDSGLAVGAAALGTARLAGIAAFPQSARDRQCPYIGPALEQDAGGDGIPKTCRLASRPVDSPDTVEELYRNLAAGKIVGMVRGRSEIGPRALGNRSILANPALPEIRDTLNAKVKYREWWRPFAPVCRQQEVDIYFETVRYCPYMLYSAMVRPEWRDRLPSITHIDGSARLQVLHDRDEHPLLWDLLTAFSERSGCGVLINTSFNLGGRPILNRMGEVFEMLETTQLDAAWVDGSLVYKPDSFEVR